MKGPLCVYVKEAAHVTVTSIKWENCEDALELYGSHGLTETLYHSLKGQINLIRGD